jgi:hypothetical protein
MSAYPGQLPASHQTNQIAKQHIRVDQARRSVSFSSRSAPAWRLYATCILRRYIPPSGHQLRGYCRNSKPRAWRLYSFGSILLPHSAPANYLQPGRTQYMNRANNSRGLSERCKAFMLHGIDVDSRGASSFPASTPRRLHTAQPLALPLLWSITQ